MKGKSTHLQVILQQSTQNSKFAITECEKEPVDTSVHFSSRDNFDNLGSFAKAYVPVGFIISWWHTQATGGYT